MYDIQMDWLAKTKEFNEFFSFLNKYLLDFSIASFYYS